ncbi:MAG: TRAP transporter small permease [Alcaligenaceae bacterium]|nr:TRAP transporter small permease [Alcaligenaceae bacterium]
MESGVVRLEGALLFSVLVLLLATLTMQVASRFLLEIPLAWTEELARVLQIWLVFIGAAIGTRRCEHFVVELFMEKVNFPGKQAVARAIDIIVVAFFALLTWIAAQTTIDGAGQILPTLDISIAWAYIAIPIGSLLIAFHFIMAWVRPQETDHSFKEVAE